MEILFKSPLFFSMEDEDVFFRWICALPAYQDIKGCVTDLHLQLKDPVDETTSRNLLVIFRRWCLDIAPLAPLKTAENSNLTLWKLGIEEAVASRFRCDGDDKETHTE